MMVRQDLSAGEWQLIIKDVRYSDAGQYECQINTSPVLSHTLKLAVVGEYSASAAPMVSSLVNISPLFNSQEV